MPDLGEKFPAPPTIFDSCFGSYHAIGIDDVDDPTGSQCKCERVMITSAAFTPRGHVDLISVVVVEG